MDLDHASDGWFFHKVPSSIETPIAPNADFNPLLKTNKIYIVFKKGAMLQRSQIFSPFHVRTTLCFKEVDHQKKYGAWTINIFLIKYIYIYKITGHISLWKSSFQGASPEFLHKPQGLLEIRFLAPAHRNDRPVGYLMPWGEISTSKLICFEFR